MEASQLRRVVAHQKAHQPSALLLEEEVQQLWVAQSLQST
jgi:hypothetical protein